MFDPAAWHVLSFRRGFRRGFPYAFGERYPLCLEHLCLLSRCKRSLDYLNVRHVTNTCTSRDKHMYVTWQTPICYVSIHPSAMWQTPTQYTGRGRFVCIVQLPRKRKARRTTGLYSRKRLHNTFEQRSLCRNRQKCFGCWVLGFGLPCGWER